MLQCVRPPHHHVGGGGTGTSVLTAVPITAKLARQRRSTSTTSICTPRSSSNPNHASRLQTTSTTFNFQSGYRSFSHAHLHGSAPAPSCPSALERTPATPWQQEASPAGLLTHHLPDQPACDLGPPVAGCRNSRHSGIAYHEGWR